MVEAASCDGLVELLWGLQLSAGVFVPEAEASVWAHSSQGAVDRMEGDGIHLVGGNANKNKILTDITDPNQKQEEIMQLFKR